MSNDNQNLLAAIGALSGLAGPAPALLNPHKIEDRVYKNQAINLDGYHFYNCAFINCVLSSSKGNFSFHSCYFQTNQIQLEGNALTAVRLASICNWQNVPYWHAEIEPDGATTIR